MLDKEKTVKFRGFKFRSLQYFNLMFPLEHTRRYRSICIRHLDCGSCNACELELTALTNPIYDIGKYGFYFEASPRHADVLAMTGVFTRNLSSAANRTLQAMPIPRIISIGDCAIDGGLFKSSYAILPPHERPPQIQNAVVQIVAGCPPTPNDILDALFKLDMKSINK